MAVVNENTNQQQERTAQGSIGAGVDATQDVISRVRQNRLQEEAVEESEAESFMDQMADVYTSAEASEGADKDILQDASGGVAGAGQATGHPVPPEHEGILHGQYSDQYDPHVTDVEDVHESAESTDRYYINTDPDTKGEIYTSEDIDAMREVLAQDDAMAGNGSYEDSLNALQDGSYAEKDTEDQNESGKESEDGYDHSLYKKDAEDAPQLNSYEADADADQPAVSDGTKSNFAPESVQDAMTGTQSQAADSQYSDLYDSEDTELHSAHEGMSGASVEGGVLGKPDEETETETESANVGHKMDENEMYANGATENQLDMSNSTITDENGNTYVRQYTDEEKAHMREVVAAADSIDGKGDYESNLEALQEGSFAKTEQDTPQAGHEGSAGPGHHGPMGPGHSHAHEMSDTVDMSQQFSMEDDLYDMSQYANAGLDDPLEDSKTSSLKKEHSGMEGMGGRPPMEFDHSLNDVSGMFGKESEESEDFGSEGKHPAPSKGKAPQRSHEETMEKADKALGKIVDRVAGNEDAFEDEDDSQFGE